MEGLLGLQLKNTKLSNSIAEEENKEVELMTIKEGMMFSSHYWSRYKLLLWDLEGNYFNCLFAAGPEDDIEGNIGDYTGINYISKTKEIILGCWNGELVCVDIFKGLITERIECMRGMHIRAIHQLTSDMLLIQGDCAEIAILNVSLNTKSLKKFSYPFEINEIELNM